LIPKDSRDKNWQGPKTKTQLRIADFYFYDCLKAATCEQDLFDMENSPEWIEWVAQCEHDMPDLLVDGDEPSVVTILEDKRKEL